MVEMQSENESFWTNMNVRFRDLEEKNRMLRDRILLIGQNLIETKEKTSEVYEINKLFHIEINHVKKLGWFLEIEYLADKKGVEKARQRVLEVMKKLGIEKQKIIKDGYTKMLWDKTR